MDDSSRTRESLEGTVTQGTATPSLMTTISVEVVKNFAVMAPMENFAAEIVWKGSDESIKDLLPSPSSSFPSGLELSFDKSQKRFRNKAPKKRNSTLKSFSRQSQKEA